MNLIQELSLPYFQERFGGCMFFDPDRKPCYIDVDTSWPKNHVGIVRVSGPASKPEVEKATLPYEFFTDMSILKVPPLGWRSAAQGRYMVYFSRNNRAYHRGVSREVLQRWVSPASQYLMDTDNISSDYYSRAGSTAAMIMTPEFTPFHEGVANMRRGDLFSFCVSGNLAVIPDVGDSLAIYFNTNKVGTVGTDNTINCTIPLISKLIKDQT